uniref:Secreted protein n=1 Tax=Haemonchus placei TaxID=6290 RepID=A0A158QRI4_HAEPC
LKHRRSMSIFVRSHLSDSTDVIEFLLGQLRWFYLRRRRQRADVFFFRQIFEDTFLLSFLLMKGCRRHDRRLTRPMPGFLHRCHFINLLDVFKFFLSELGRLLLGSRRWSMYFFFRCHIFKGRSSTFSLLHNTSESFEAKSSYGLCIKHRGRRLTFFHLFN